MVIQSNTTQTGTSNAQTPHWLSAWKDFAAASASSLTAVSLIIGGIWSYFLFVRKRQRYPRADVEHGILHWPVGGQRLLRVTVRLKNLGDVIVRVARIRTAVTRVFPIPSDVEVAVAQERDPVEPGKSEILWDTLADRHCDFSVDGCEVEPGEAEDFFFDFVIPSGVATVQVYTHVENVKKWKKNIGWNTTSIHDLSDTTEELSMAKSGKSSLRTSQGQPKPIKPAPNPPKKG